MMATAALNASLPRRASPNRHWQRDRRRQPSAFLSQVAAPDVREVMERGHPFGPGVAGAYEYQWVMGNCVNDSFDAIVIGAGQAGLATGYHLQQAGLRFVVLEAGRRPGGSWPSYYDSLTLFSPARYSGLPGLDFPGDPGHYPHRDEVVAYLRRYAASLGADIRTSTPVTAVQAHDRAGFLVHTAGGQSF